MIMLIFLILITNSSIAYDDYDDMDYEETVVNETQSNYNRPVSKDQKKLNSFLKVIINAINGTDKYDFDLLEKKKYEYTSDIFPIPILINIRNKYYGRISIDHFFNGKLEKYGGVIKIFQTMEQIKKKFSGSELSISNWLAIGETELNNIAEAKSKITENVEPIGSFLTAAEDLLYKRCVVKREELMINFFNTVIGFVNKGLPSTKIHNIINDIIPKCKIPAKYIGSTHYTTKGLYMLINNISKMVKDPDKLNLFKDVLNVPNSTLSVNEQQSLTEHTEQSNQVEMYTGSNQAQAGHSELQDLIDLTRDDYKGKSSISYLIAATNDEYDEDSIANSTSMDCLEDAPMVNMETSPDRHTISGQCY